MVNPAGPIEHGAVFAGEQELPGFVCNLSILAANVMSLRLLLIVLVAVFIAVVSFRFFRRRRLQFGLRSLLVGCLLVALVLSGVLSWNYWTKAKMTWLDPSSPEAASLVSEPVIVEGGLGYKMTFRPRCRSLGQLVDILGKAKLPAGTSARSKNDYNSQEMTLETGEREPLEARIAVLKAADVLQPGCFVIRGRVEDSLGRPVPNATVDLLGSYVYVNHFRTRDDGTFLMPIQAPPGWGYYLRIRYDGDRRRMNTQRFTLEASSREMAVLIRVR